MQTSVIGHPASSGCQGRIMRHVLKLADHSIPRWTFYFTQPIKSTGVHSLPDGASSSQRTRRCARFGLAMGLLWPDLNQFFQSV